MRKLLLGLLLLLVGCGWGGSATEARQELPADALSGVAGARLDDALELLDRQLVTALRKNLEGGGLANFTQAEALTDRLLETRLPFEYLRADSYNLQAKLRQIQALADRIGAQLRSGAPHEESMGDLERLRLEVLTLRKELALGGGPQPPPLERLLAGRDTLDLLGGEDIAGD